jgi:cytochrome c5
MNWGLFFLVSSLCILLGLLACQGNAQSQGQDLLMGKCVSCHSNQITCMNLGEDLAYWEKTVERMVQKGMEMTTEEQAVISEYLAGLTSGHEAVCE